MKMRKETREAIDFGDVHPKNVLVQNFWISQFTLRNLKDRGMRRSPLRFRTQIDPLVIKTIFSIVAYCWASNLAWKDGTICAAINTFLLFRLFDDDGGSDSKNEVG
jgi:hypothetical protein